MRSVLIDGGVMNNIPVDHASRVPGDLLVVVNVNASIPVALPKISREEDEKQKRAYQKKIEEFQVHLQKILPHGFAEKHARSHEERMSYFNLIDRTISLMTNHMAQMSMKNFPPDVMIEISRDACGTFDFFKAGQLLEMGRAAAVEALDKLESQ